MRTSIKYIEHQIEFINKLLARPVASYQKDATTGKYIAQIGNFHIDSNSPGDGVTRYRLAEMMSLSGGIREVNSLACLGKSEFAVFLDAFIAGIEYAQGKRNL